MALSPMMQHYLTTKEENKDCLLLYRLGDFYELFFDDAITVSNELDLTLTSKSCGLKEKAPMCGVPAKSVEIYVGKLIELGYKVAVCEQISEPMKGKMVERDVVRVVTPGTIMETDLLDDKKNNYIACIYKSNENVGIAYSDISTGQFNVIDLDGQNLLKNLNDVLIMINPSEIICNEEMHSYYPSLLGVKNNELSTFYNYKNSSFDINKSKKLLLDHFNINSLSVFDINSKKSSIISSGALIEYLNETQKRSLTQIKKINRIKPNENMYLDSTTRKNLELTQTQKDGQRKGSVLWLLDKTCTSMGSRTLRSWVEKPLHNEIKINDRLSGVEELYSNIFIRDNLVHHLKKVNDIERLASKISYKSITPRDCVALLDSLKQLPNIESEIKKCESKIIKNIVNDFNDFEEVIELLEKSIFEDSPTTLKDGGYIKDGYSSELDEYRVAGVDGKKWLVDLEIKEKQKTGIKHLKVGFNRVFGYFIEITNSQKHLVPDNYFRKQTLTGAERFITEELKIIEDKILGSHEKKIKLEIELYNEIKETLNEYVEQLQETAQAVSRLDCILSLATIAIENNYVKPLVDKNIKDINIINGRHPVVEKLAMDDEFVPNNTALNNDDNKIMLITGPNMAGKSTYMRQVALIVLISHIGSFVPADEAKISLTNRIFTRIGASDDLSNNQSTFMVEMVEVANIILNSNDSSLIILDEIGRGTSTYDGLSIAWSVIEHLAYNSEAKTLFSTHYHELTQLEGKINGIKNYNIRVKEYNENIIFLRKIVRGGTNKSYGIQVAKLAGIPNVITNRAKQILESLSVDKNTIGSNSTSKCCENNTICKDTLKEYINGIDIDSITPLDSMSVLNEIIKKIKKD